MKLLRPVVIGARPGILIPIIGGVAGTLIMTASLYLTPLIGFPAIDIPRLVGGVFVADPDAALLLGFGLHFLNGAIILPIVFGLVWLLLPGPMTGIVGDTIKGITWGLLLWVLMGIMIPIAGSINRLPTDVVQSAGFFGFAMGWQGAFALLGAHILYGLALGLTSYMAADIFPLETLGWEGYRKAELPPAGELYQTGFPEYPHLGNR